ncbi:MAG: site-2 protease family protein [Clostridia bacterium]|nr:site-2 protease family protein [Clostridia bacterium]
MIVLYIGLAIVVLMLMILIHELGHFLVGKWLGFRINEFSIGFGKAIWQKTNAKGEKISLRILPLGGYCAFYGEEGDEETADGKKIKAKDDPDIFTNQPPWKRILVFFAGVFFNFVSAVIFSFILLISFGYGNIYVITEDANPNFLATNIAGNELVLIEKGDKILKIDGQNISYVWGNTIDTMTSRVDGNVYQLTIQKAETGEILNVNVIIQTGVAVEYNQETGLYEDVLDNQENPVTYTGLGLTMGITSQPLPFWEALAQCLSFTIGLAWLVLKTLWLLVTFQLPLSALGGTVTVISTVASTVQQSFSALFVYLPLIAVNLAVFNLLPFPALDGSHIAFTSIEWARGKPINRNVEAWVHFVGFVLLIGFVILVDLLHFLA